MIASRSWVQEFRGRVSWTPLFSILCGLVAWIIATSEGWVRPYQLPSPLTIWWTFIEVTQIGYGGASLWTSLAVSSFRLIMGCIVAGVLGIVIGLGIATSKILRGAIDPLFEFFRVIPALGILSLLVVWFGIGETSKIVTLTLAALPPIVLSTAHGISSIGVERIQGARSLGLGGYTLLRYVMWPSALPAILDGLRVAFAYAFGTLVAAEMIGASSGLGWMVWNASQYAETSVVFVDLLIIGLIGVTVDSSLSAIRHKLVPWVGVS